jgi:hypothetical protein
LNKWQKVTIHKQVIEDLLAKRKGRKLLSCFDT